MTWHLLSLVLISSLPRSGTMGPQALSSRSPNPGTACSAPPIAHVLSNLKETLARCLPGRQRHLDEVPCARPSTCTTALWSWSSCALWQLLPVKARRETSSCQARGDVCWQRSERKAASAWGMAGVEARELSAGADRGWASLPREV